MYSLIFIFILIIVPIINVVYFANTSYKYLSNRNNSRVFNQIAHEFKDENRFLPKSKDIQCILQRNNIASHLCNEFLRNYKKLYITTKLYFFGVISSAVFIVGYILSLLFITYRRIDLLLMCLTFSSMLVFGLQLPPIIKTVGNTRLSKVADIMGRICYEIISPDGLIYYWIFEIYKQFLIFVVNVLLFGTCVFIFDALKIQKNLFSTVTFLFLYQYFIIRFVAYFFNIIARKTKQYHWSNFIYVYCTMKNNTYLLFLLFYLLIKYVQIHVQVEFGTVLAESIGILFLFDTYIAQYKACEKLKTNSDDDE